MKRLDNKEGWEQISKSYQKRYDIKTNKYYWGPLCDSSDLDTLLGTVKGKKVLELGSGSAQNSIFLSKRGAEVTAFDISEEQLKHGKELAISEKAIVEFVQGNFEEVEKHFGPESFDLVVSAFALQYCMTVDSLESVMRQMFRLLKPNGSLVFSADHPVRDHGYWNSEDNFILNNYFDREMKTWQYEFPEDNISATMTGSFKTVSDYVMSVIKAGFVINNLLEPEPILEERSNNFATRSRYVGNPKANPFSYEHLRRIPGTIIVKATKYEPIARQ